MQIYNPHTGQHETPTHFRSCAAFTIDPIPLAEVLKDHPEAEYSPVYSTGETSEVHYTVSAISMRYTNGTPKQGTAHCLNPATGKWELPTHYLAYEAETNSWSAPIAARHAAELPADTVLTPVLTGRGYGEPTTAGALAEQMRSKPKPPEAPSAKTIGETFNASTSEASPQTREQRSTEPDKNENERLALLPSEVRAVEYLLQHTELKGAISEAKRLFDKSASFIELALYLNIAAIIILLFVLVITLGK